MSEQYAFAIGFDREPADSGDRSDYSWTSLCGQVSAAIDAAALPSIESQRWDEFGQGRVFWGTKAECEAVRQVLSQFDLYIEEDRNLDPGYYSTASQTYYVDGAGTIYVLPSDLGPENCDSLKPITSIPLDAYRSKTVDFELDLRIQTLLQEMVALDHPIEMEGMFAPESAPELMPTGGFEIGVSPGDRPVPITAQPMEPTVIHPEVHAALQIQSAQQAAEILKLKHQLSLAEAQAERQTPQIDALKIQLEQAISPQDYAKLQQKCSAQAVQIQELQQFVQRLEQQLRESTQTAAQKVDASKYEALELELVDQSTLVEDLRRTMQQQERDLGEWQTVAEAKVNWSEHQVLKEELQRLKARQKKGLLSRLFGWIS